MRGRLALGVPSVTRTQSENYKKYCKQGGTPDTALGAEERPRFRVSRKKHLMAAV